MRSRCLSSEQRVRGFCRRQTGVCVRFGPHSRLCPLTRGAGVCIISACVLRSLARFKGVLVSVCIAGLQDLLATWEQAVDVEEARRVKEKLQIARKQLEVMRP